MDIKKILTYAFVIFLLLLLFSFVGAVTLPALPGVGSILVVSTVLELIFFILSVVVLSFIGYLLGKGIRGIKSPVEALIMTYMSALLIGGILALLTFFHFPYSAHVNFSWLGDTWYAPWITVFIIGAPITLAFLV